MELKMNGGGSLKAARVTVILGCACVRVKVLDHSDFSFFAFSSLLLPLLSSRHSRDYLLTLLTCFYKGEMSFLRRVLSLQREHCFSSFLFVLLGGSECIDYEKWEFPVPLLHSNNETLDEHRQMSVGSSDEPLSSTPPRFSFPFLSSFLHYSTA